MRALIITDFHRGYNPKTANIQEKAYGSLNHDLFDCIIVSGDWGITKLDHVKGAFRYLRRTFPEKPIYGVLGNHDFWDKKTSLESRYILIEKYAKESSIHLLENNPAHLMGYDLIGYNGWFHNYEYDRNEVNYISQYGGAGAKTIVSRLQEKEVLAVDFIKNLILPNREKTILVSHFPCFEETFEGEFDNGNPSNKDVIVEKAKFFIYGHTHEEFYKEIESTIVMNVGAEYGQARFKIYNFDTMKYELEYK